MALYDWNGNGKKNSTDGFIEYQIYKQSTSKNSSNNYIPRSGGGISTFGAIVAVVGGLFLAAAIVALFGGEEDTPVFITILLWIVCGSGLCAWLNYIGL